MSDFLETGEFFFSPPVCSLFPLISQGRVLELTPLLLPKAFGIQKAGLFPSLPSASRRIAERGDVLN